MVGVCTGLAIGAAGGATVVAAAGAAGVAGGLTVTTAGGLSVALGAAGVAGLTVVTGGLFGVALGAAGDKMEEVSMDCWKTVTGDASMAPSGGRTLDEILRHDAVNEMAMRDMGIYIRTSDGRNVKITIDWVGPDTDQMFAGHAEPIHDTDEIPMDLHWMSAASFMDELPTKHDEACEMLLTVLKSSSSVTCSKPQRDGILRALMHDSETFVTALEEALGGAPDQKVEAAYLVYWALGRPKWQLPILESKKVEERLESMLKLGMPPAKINAALALGKLWGLQYHARNQAAISDLDEAAVDTFIDMCSQDTHGFKQNALFALSNLLLVKKDSNNSLEERLTSQEAMKCWGELMGGKGETGVEHHILRVLTNLACRMPTSAEKMMNLDLKLIVFWATRRQVVALHLLMNLASRSEERAAKIMAVLDLKMMVKVERAVCDVEEKSAAMQLLKILAYNSEECAAKIMEVLDLEWVQMAAGDASSSELKCAAVHLLRALAYKSEELAAKIMEVLDLELMVQIANGDASSSELKCAAVDLLRALGR